MAFPELSTEQWHFMAALDAIGLPVAVELAEGLVRLGTGPLIDLITGGLQAGWIERDSDPDANPASVTARMGITHDYTKLVEQYGEDNAEFLMDFVAQPELANALLRLATDACDLRAAQRLEQVVA